MRSSTTTFNGVSATVYFMMKGDKLPRHQHSANHTTTCLAGRFLLEIADGRPPRTQNRHSPPIYIPADTDHELTAHEDNTIVLDMIDSSNGGHHSLITSSEEGSVMMKDPLP